MVVLASQPMIPLGYIITAVVGIIVGYLICACIGGWR